MPIVITNVTEPPDDHGENSYEIQIGPHVIARFHHVRQDGLGDCLRRAATAIDKALGGNAEKTR